MSLLLLCFAVAAYIVTAWWMKFQKELNIKLITAIILSVAHFVLVFAAMKLWAIVEVGGDLERAASMRLFGGLFLLPPLYYLWAKLTKRDVALVMDMAGIILVISLFFGRTNCLIQECCDGLPIPFAEDWRWPIREAEMVYSCIFVFIFARRMLKKQSRGFILTYTFLSYGTLRFVLEWAREEYTGSLGVFHLAHIWSLLAVAVGVLLYLKALKEQRSSKVTKKKKEKGGKK